MPLQRNIEAPQFQAVAVWAGNRPLRQWMLHKPVLFDSIRKTANTEFKPGSAVLAKGIKRAEIAKALKTVTTQEQFAEMHDDIGEMVADGIYKTYINRLFANDPQFYQNHFLPSLPVFSVDIPEGAEVSVSVTDPREKTFNEQRFKFGRPDTNRYTQQPLMHITDMEGKIASDLPTRFLVDLSSSPINLDRSTNPPTAGVVPQAEWGDNPGLIEDMLIPIRNYEQSAMFETLGNLMDSMNLSHMLNTGYFTLLLPTDPYVEETFAKAQEEFHQFLFDYADSRGLTSIPEIKLRAFALPISEQEITERTEAVMHEAVLLSGISVEALEKPVVEEAAIAVKPVESYDTISEGLRIVHVPQAEITAQPEATPTLSVEQYREYMATRHAVLPQYLLPKPVPAPVEPEGISIPPPEAAFPPEVSRQKISPPIITSRSERDKGKHGKKRGKDKGKGQRPEQRPSNQERKTKETDRVINLFEVQSYIDGDPFLRSLPDQESVRAIAHGLGKNTFSYVTHRNSEGKIVRRTSIVKGATNHPNNLRAVIGRGNDLLVQAIESFNARKGFEETPVFQTPVPVAQGETAMAYVIDSRSEKFSPLDLFEGNPLEAGYQPPEHISELSTVSGIPLARLYQLAEDMRALRKTPAPDKRAGYSGSNRLSVGIAGFMYPTNYGASDWVSEIKAEAAKRDSKGNRAVVASLIPSGFVRPLNETSSDHEEAVAKELVSKYTMVDRNAMKTGVATLEEFNTTVFPAMSVNNLIPMQQATEVSYRVVQDIVNAALPLLRDDPEVSTGFLMSVSEFYQRGIIEILQEELQLHAETRNKFTIASLHEYQALIDSDFTATRFDYTTRYTQQTLQAYSNQLIELSATYPEVRPLLYILRKLNNAQEQHDEATTLEMQKILHDLRQTDTRTVTIEGKTFNKIDMDAIYIHAILNPDVLASIFLTDTMLRSAYDIESNYLTNEEEYRYYESMKLLSNLFTPTEIRHLFINQAPDTSAYDQEIAEAGADADKVFRINSRKTLFLQQMATPLGRLRTAIEERIGHETPKREDYLGGEKAPAFQKALAAYYERCKLYPTALDVLQSRPLEDDYEATDQYDSPAFITAKKTFDAYNYALETRSTHRKIREQARRDKGADTRSRRGMQVPDIDQATIERLIRENPPKPE